MRLAVAETVRVATRLVRYSRRLYAYMGSTDGVPWGALLVMAGTVVLGYGMGSLTALVWGTDPSEWGELGIYVGVVLCVLVLLVATGVSTLR